MNAAFNFLSLNERDEKPRSNNGLTKIRGPYYSCLGTRQLSDVFDLAGAHVDGVKFAGGSFMVMPERAVRELTELCHAHKAYVSTGGAIERVLAGGAGPRNVASYLDAVKSLGFDVVELSTGFISLPLRDWANLVEEVQDTGLKAKPEVGIQFGAGGTSSVESLAAEGTRDVRQLVDACTTFKEQGVGMIMIESEGITEQVPAGHNHTDVVAAISSEVGLDNVMFEAADPQVFSWYIKTYGAGVNLFVDHSQILQLECLRRGVWGTNDTWGRIVTYPHTNRGSKKSANAAGGEAATGEELAPASAATAAAGAAATINADYIVGAGSSNA